MASPEFEEWPVTGEVVSLPPEVIAAQVHEAAEPIGYLHHARMVADFEDVDGRIYRSGLDEADVEPRVGGNYNVYLKSHKKQIVMIGGALLFAAGVGASLQFNRSYRKKKKR